MDLTKNYVKYNEESLKLRIEKMVQMYQTLKIKMIENKEVNRNNHIDADGVVVSS